MKERTILFFILAVGIVSAAQLFVIFTTLSPYSTANEVFWTVFICLFFSSSSIGALLWHSLKHMLYYKDKRSGLWPSYRQAALVCLVIVLSLFFKSLGILTLWDTIPLAISAILIEFFFQADKTSVHEKPSLN